MALLVRSNVLVALLGALLFSSTTAIRNQDELEEELSFEHEEVGRKREDVGHKHEEAGREHEEVGREHEEVGRKHEEAGHEHEEVGRKHEEVARKREEVVHRSTRARHNLSHVECKKQMQIVSADGEAGSYLTKFLDPNRNSCPDTLVVYFNGKKDPDQVEILMPDNWESSCSAKDEEIETTPFPDGLDLKSAAATCTTSSWGGMKNSGYNTYKVSLAFSNGAFEFLVDAKSR